MLALNQILHTHYRIVRQLGSGGMGAVYEAIDERFGEPIALKEIILETNSEERNYSIFKAFEREAKYLAKARHEAIPFVRDYFSEADRQYLVMELIEGDDLSKLLIKRQKAFAVTDALRWLDQLLDALDYLHTLDPPIIHRDIKPQNLKVTQRGKIKLLDFGIAKSPDTTAATSTSQTFVGATLEYSPIEQILRVIDPTFREFILLKHKTEGEDILRQNTDARSDIYSLGATFYHLLTNQPPVESTKRTLEIWSGNPDPVENPSDINSDISPALSAFLLKAMEIERDNRFSSALEMQKALQIVIANDKQTKFKAADIKPVTTEKPEIIQSAETQPSPIVIPEVGKINTIENNIQKTHYDAADSSANREAKVSIPTIITNEQRQDSANKTSGTRWLLPAAALSVLAVGGIGGAVWMSNLNSGESSKPVANTVVTTPTVSATIVPSVAPTSTPTVSPTVQTAAQQQEPKPKATVKMDKTPAPTPAKKVTPKPRNDKPSQDPNCVFTNSCQ